MVEKIHVLFFKTATSNSDKFKLDSVFSSGLEEGNPRGAQPPSCESKECDSTLSRYLDCERLYKQQKYQ